MSDDRARRVGLNEALFRRVNEEINALNAGFDDIREMTVICECGNGDCTQHLHVAVSDYERVRSDPHRYLIVPGHEIPDVETVVEEGDGYAVVEKDAGTPAKLSEELDPRS